MLWCVAAFSIAGTLFFGSLAAVGFVIDNHLDNSGVTTNATVTDVDGGTVTVEFTTEDNHRITADFTWFPEENPAVDDRIEITYDPDDPYYVIRAGSDEDQVLAMAFAAAAFCTLGVTAGASVGAVLIHRARAKAARATGYYY